MRANVLLICLIALVLPVSGLIKGLYKRKVIVSSRSDLVSSIIIDCFVIALFAALFTEDFLPYIALPVKLLDLIFVVCLFAFREISVSVLLALYLLFKKKYYNVFAARNKAAIIQPQIKNFIYAFVLFIPLKHLFFFDDALVLAGIILFSVITGLIDTIGAAEKDYFSIIVNIVHLIYIVIISMATTNILWVVLYLSCDVYYKIYMNKKIYSGAKS